MNEKIKFGTDGWRAIIAKDFTVDNLARVATATAKWLLSKNPKASVTLGHDCRFAGEMFAETSAKIFANHGIKVYLAKGFVSTPMVSLATKDKSADAGVIITASHNPPSYNGFKIKASYGGPALPAMIDEVEALIPDWASVPGESLEFFLNNGMIEWMDMETLYANHVQNSFDLNLINNSKLQLGYDAMYGAGQGVMRRLFPEATFLHADYNPGFEGQAPEPIDKNLAEFRELIKIAGDIDLGLATDGDADRIGLYNSTGKFIDSHHIILLLIQYLYKVKGYTGKVVTSFSCSSKIEKMCKAYGLEQITTKIGFKYICEYMVSDDVLVGGEESGGIAIKGHIPERDGIWMGLTLLEFMAKSGKSLDQLIDEVYEVVGSFAMDRIDLHISEEIKQKVLEYCNNNFYQKFGDLNVERIENTDGFKFHLGNEEWVMIRASGTEPVLRVYAEAADLNRVHAILNATKETILN